MKHNYEIPSRVAVAILLTLSAFILPCPALAQDDPTILGADEKYIDELTGAPDYQSATGMASRADWMHDALFMKVQRTINDLDGRFAESDDVKERVPVSRFRIGMYAEIIKEQDTEFGINPDFDIELKTPNVERRMSLYLTTKELDELPGTDPTDRDQGLRLGVRRELPANMRLSAGLKFDWPLNPYVKTGWGDEWEAGEWQLYSGLSAYWRRDDGFGSGASFTGDRWMGRKLFRTATGTRWAEDSENVEWSQTLIFGYAHTLINENVLGQRASGRDLARGGAFRYTAAGETERGVFTLHELTFLFKRALRKKWAYLVLAPGITFRNERDWEPEPGIQFGVDMLFWDLGDR